MTVVPTGEVHKVDVEDLFFSTTDRKGVILLANHVFASYARRDYQELVGAPHNIIRHPDMPGGAFRIVWRMLEDGKPTCAYVKNLAGDGSAYWAFATLAPIGDHYLSVRSSPCQSEVKEPLHAAYARVRTIEAEARESGASAAQAAELGETALLAELSELGFASYEDFLRVVVPAEIAARQLRSRGIPESKASGTLKLLNAHSMAIHRKVTGLGVDLASFESTAHRLSGGAEGAVTALRELTETLQQASRKVGAVEDRAPVVAKAVGPLGTQTERIAERLTAVGRKVAELRDGRSTLRFSVALAQLQSEMIGRYTVAVEQGTEDAEISDNAINELVAAVDQGLHEVVADLSVNLEQSQQMRDEIDSAGAALRLMTMSTAKWRELVDKFGLSAQLADEVTALDASLATIGKHLESLSADAAAFAEGAVRFDMEALAAELNEVMTLSGYTRPVNLRPVQSARVINLTGGSHLDRLLGR